VWSLGFAIIGFIELAKGRWQVAAGWRPGEHRFRHPKHYR
jgi:hypothetical protein